MRSFNTAAINYCDRCRTSSATAQMWKFVVGLCFFFIYKSILEEHHFILQSWCLFQPYCPAVLPSKYIWCSCCFRCSPPLNVDSLRLVYGAFFMFTYLSLLSESGDWRVTVVMFLSAVGVLVALRCANRCPLPSSSRSPRGVFSCRRLPFMTSGFKIPPPPLLALNYW